MAEPITVIFYNNYSANNVVNKQKTQITSMSGQLKQNVDMEKVVLTVPYFAGYASVNYARIAEFNRYYYCTIEVCKGGILTVKMVSDPISSFFSMYKNSPCIAKRSACVENPDIVDETTVWSPQPKIIHRKIGTPFTPTSTGNCYVLTLGGK